MATPSPSSNQESRAGPQAASYGNGAWLSPASVVPMSMPGLWRKVPGFLLDRDGPLTIRWTMLPRLMPWLARFILAGATIGKVEATARALSSLLHDAPERHAALAAEIGQPGLIRRTGLLYAYPNREAFLAEALAWRLRRDNGVGWVELGARELREREPALATRYGFGALVEAGAHCTDPGAYVAALAAHAVGHGAELRRAAATGFEIENGRLRNVLTSDGTIACDRAVICAGIRSKDLARDAGDAVPLESERGYHVVIEGSGVVLETPVMPSDGKMANTSTRAGLRVSGQVELASVDAAAGLAPRGHSPEPRARDLPRAGRDEGCPVPALDRPPAVDARRAARHRAVLGMSGYRACLRPRPCRGLRRVRSPGGWPPTLRVAARRASTSGRSPRHAFADRSQVHLKTFTST